jgi:hypothetical protein
MIRKSKSALLVGCGGGGDILQTIPLMNFVRELGVQTVCLADIGVKWWEQYGEMAVGCEALSLDWLSPIQRIGEHAALIEPATQIISGRGTGEKLHEAVISAELGVPTATISLRGGLPGVRQGIEALIAHFKADLFITVDIGADSFFTGEETTVMSPLVDAISLACATTLTIPALFALTGYGCDAEIPLAHLDRNVAKAMQNGGYLGAYGLSQQDVADVGRVLAHFPGEQVEIWPYEAARGNLGTHYCKQLWAMEVGPLTAVDLFFDPQVIADHVNPLPNAIRASTTLLEAEEIIMKHGLFPETRLPQMIPAPSAPQVGADT